MSASEGDIYVNYGHVTNVEEALQDADKAINMVLTELEDAVQPLRATWDGASEEAYKYIMSVWQSNTADMQNILAKYNTTLSEMSYNYGNTDSNLALQWSEIT